MIYTLLLKKFYFKQYLIFIVIEETPAFGCHRGTPNGMFNQSCIMIKLKHFFAIHKMYQQFISFLHTVMTQVIEVLPRV